MIVFGRVDPSLGQSEQGQAGLGTAAERLGLAERLLGPVEVADAAADLAELHEAGGGVHAADPDELRAGPDRLLFGSGPLDHEHCRAHARWTRHTPGKTANGWRSDHRAVASVHSAARRRSPSSSQALIRLQ